MRAHTQTRTHARTRDSRLIPPLRCRNRRFATVSRLEIDARAHHPCRTAESIPIGQRFASVGRHEDKSNVETCIIHRRVHRGVRGGRYGRRSRCGLLPHPRGSDILVVPLRRAIRVFGVACGERIAEVIAPIKRIRPM